MKLNKAVRLSMIVAPLLSSVFAKEAATPATPAAHALPKYKDGYTMVEANGFTLTFGGRVKADAYYDLDGRQPGTPTGLDVANIPLKGYTGTAPVSLNSYKKGNFNYTLNHSRLSMDAKKKFGSIDVRGFVEFDFNGNANTTTNSLAPRLRHAFFESCGLVIGQTTYAYTDPNSLIFAFDNLWGSSREATIRYTFKMNKELSLMIAADRPNTQLYQVGTNNAGGGLSPIFTDNSSDTSASKSQFPDGVAFLKYESNGSHLALRGIARDLQVRTKTGASLGTATTAIAREDYKKSILGWGVGVSGKLKAMDNFKIMGSYNYGKGLGRYMDELVNGLNFDSVFTYPIAGAAGTTARSSAFKAVKMWNTSLGLELRFTDKIWMNLSGAYAKISKPSNMTVVTNNFPKSYQRYIGNIVYDILPNTRVGLEVLHYRRKTGTPSVPALATDKHYSGRDTRVLTSLIYNI